MGSEIGAEVRIGRGFREELGGSFDEEAAGGVIPADVALELNGVLGKGIMHELKQAARDPGIVHLKFHDEEAVGLQQEASTAHRLARIDIVVDAYVGEV